MGSGRPGLREEGLGVWTSGSEEEGMGAWTPRSEGGGDGVWTPGSEEEGPGAWTLALTEQGLGAWAGVGSGLAASGPAVGSVTTPPLVMGPQVVKEMCGTGRVAGARRQLRTPTSACVSDAATATGSATTSVRMVRGEPGPRGGAGGGQPWVSLPPALRREHEAEAHVGAGLDVWRPPLPHQQHLPVLASGAWRGRAPLTWAWGQIGGAADGVPPRQVGQATRHAAAALVPEGQV